MTAVACEVHDSLDSTSAEARRRVSAGAFQDLWIVARRQTSGRGRRGRAWVSDSDNLYASRLIDPACPSARVAELSFVAALAARDAVRAQLPPGAPPVTCKWPNDVLIGRRKVAGLLLEGEGGSRWVVVGIGINVTDFPDGMETPATSLVAQGGTADVEAVFGALADAFEQWLTVWRTSGFAAIRAAWRDAASGLGEKVRVRLETREFEGIFRDLDPSGALIVDCADGREERVAAGDVFLL
ncbi:biotin--[acetyl-CoA-carboxylase] ligase [Govanella unica]|uniref:biotin--[biotin carboxyl-carrier protein] ligase n=1 Tax=Govanella unica TaxID=2975056 RepID=A0A9X3TXV8_9PROT|nr:biotin--[acetyl-CoA-carboxylase] ligase [Govania unica]MDA5193753.1 biotin--[acetyl-CoA-carboxylase] ligase [Govania unica]